MQNIHTNAKKREVKRNNTHEVFVSVCSLRRLQTNKKHVNEPPLHTSLRHTQTGNEGKDFSLCGMTSRQNSTAL